MKKLARRRLLQQAGLWSLLWPLVSRQQAKAQADLTPKRVVIFFSPNGPIMERGPASGTESNFELHEWWQPLERHRAEGLFFAGMQQAGVPFGEHNEYGHQSAGTGALTARTTEGTNHSTGPSLDQFIGQKLQEQGVVTPKRSLLWGLHNTVGNWGPWYEAAGKSANPEQNPYLALADIAPALAPAGDGAQPTFNPLRRKNFVLDRSYKDCKELLGKLGSEGQALLDFHCQNIESLQKSVRESLNRPLGPSCQAPLGPDTTLGPDANFGQADNRDEMMRAFGSLAALALACDVTRVIGISFGATAERFAIPAAYDIPASAAVDSGDSGPQHHAWTHVYDEGADKRKALKTFTSWYAEQVASVIDKLKATSDANGQSLMDSTLVLWTSELGHRPGNPLEPHPNEHIPVLLFGSGQGAFKTNRFYDGDSSPETSLMLHQLFVSMIQHTGLTGINEFGNQGSGPLEWLKG